MTQIELRFAYRSAHVPGGVIPAGRYDAQDPALHGLAGYLVESGHARANGPLDAPEDGTPEPVATPAAMNRDALKAALDAAGVEYNARANVETLREQYQEHLDASSPEDAER